MKRIRYLGIILLIAIIVLIGHIYLDYENKKQNQIKYLENLVKENS